MKVDDSISLAPLMALLLLEIPFSPATFFLIFYLIYFANADRNKALSCLDAFCPQFLALLNPPPPKVDTQIPILVNSLSTPNIVKQN